MPSQSSTRFPFEPYPISWYALIRSDSLAPGQMTHGQWCGQEIVIYRTETGQVKIIEAHCPHLGAHIGYGGDVDGEDVVCPFHHFRYDKDGQCIDTPYDKSIPKNLCLKFYPAMESNGLIWMWWHPESQPPTFSLPDAPQDGWSALRTTTWKLRSHPQETNENVADLGHLSVVHGYQNIEVIKPFTSDGATSFASYKATRPTTVAGVSLGNVPFRFNAIAAGLGCGYVEAIVSNFGIRSRHFVFCTPIDGELVQLTIGNQLKMPDDLGDIHPILKLIPRSWLTAIAAPITMRQYEQDVRQDWDIWERKIYVHPPRLADGDGPIGAYRQWCTQFYIDEPQGKHRKEARVQFKDSTPSDNMVGPISK